MTHGTGFGVGRTSGVTPGSAPDNGGGGRELPEPQFARLHSGRNKPVSQMTFSSDNWRLHM